MFMNSNSVLLIKFYLIILNFYLINKNKTVRSHIFPCFIVVHIKESLIKSQMSE